MQTLSNQPGDHSQLLAADRIDVGELKPIRIPGS